MRTGLAAMLLLSACGADENHLPVAIVDVMDAGGGVVRLDARASSDEDGDRLSYAWAVDFAPEGSDGDPLAYVVPGVVELGPVGQPETWVIESSVSDGAASSDPLLVTIRLEPVAGNVPVARAGADREVGLGQVAYLDGTASSDPEDKALAYAWEVDSVPAGSGITDEDLAGREGPTPRLPVDVAGDYAISLVVDNGRLESAPDVVVIRAVDTENRAPEAVADAPRRSDQCEPIPLDCSASSDPDGDLLTARWTLQRAPVGTPFGEPKIEDDRAFETSAFAERLGLHTFACSVFDGVEWSRSSEVDVDVVPRASNAIPTVELGEDEVRNLGTVTCTCPSPGPWTSACSCPMCTPPSIELSPVVSDSDDADFTYDWSIVVGKAVVRGDPSAEGIQVNLPSIRPNEPGLHFIESTVQVEVQDCPGASGSDRVVVRATCEAVYP